ncbi:unnamed protein product [Diatraea saccharalis]|uniref:Uncharacterized protein n=1 Tax=Diatraea saccharalis TaxID=40085 RepID=A0A9N9R6S3_9NEOP|nr:unnamed protein product [Diatraea saccharalis]
MKNTLQTISEEISFYSEKYQELFEEKEKTDKKIKSLDYKSRQTGGNIKALEERIVFLENRDKSKNIEIIVLQEHENTGFIIIKIATKLKIDPETVIDAKNNKKKLLICVQPVSEHDVHINASHHT